MAVSSETGEEYEDVLKGYITCAEKFMSTCRDLRHIKGAQKLERMIRSELRYLMTLRKSPCDIYERDLKSSNLSHFAGILHSTCLFPDVTRILRPFSLAGKTESLTVDVVAGQGRIWVKVIARKAQALHLIWAGKGQFGERDLVKQADDYIRCAEEHQICFAPPRVHFVFYNQVTAPMAEALEGMGVVVWGERVSVNPDILRQVQALDDFTDEECDEDEEDDDDDSDDNDRDDNVENQIRDLELHQITSGVERLHSNDSEEKELSSDSVDLSLENNNQSAISSSDISQGQGQILSRISIIEESSQSSPFRRCLEFLNNCDIIPRIITSLPFKDSSDLDLCSLDPNTSQNVSLNLDITTLITMVSAVTHGGCNFIFPEKVLTQQAEEERRKPVLPLLNTLLKDKDLFACQTAVDSFYTVLNTLGGTKEKERAAEFMKRVRVVPDQPSERTKRLPETGKIKKRSKIIFGTGDELKAATVTANVGFVRAAEHQGISYAVHIIPSRPLTEMKEKLAKPLSIT